MRCTLLAFCLTIVACSTEPPAAAAGDTASDPFAVDLLDATCSDTAWTATARAAPLTEHVTGTSAEHIPLPVPIVYKAAPPSSGDHRPDWARWGEYSYLPPQRWMHNLEHGGVALLYDPCADPKLREQLYAFAKQVPHGPRGTFLWVLTPYPGLGDAVAAVAWEWTWRNDEVDTAALSDFVAAHYRNAPEDLGMVGGYELNWLRD